MSTKTPARSLGGRFLEETDKLLHQMNRSIDIDRRMWRQDIEGSRAHARMLERVGLLRADELKALLDGLQAVGVEFEEELFVFEEQDEDIHMAVERRLTELVGEPATKLHTGRSRNDQVMTDTLLWLRTSLVELQELLTGYIEALADRAFEGLEHPMPSFTHGRPAQVSSVGAWLANHAFMAERNLRRVRDLAERLDECPLGSGASAGSYLPLDRNFSATELGFARPAPSAIAATGDRSDLLDTLAVLAMIGSTVSRLGEELVLFTSPAYGWMDLPDRLTTGSSLLPHKRNPDGAELLRAGGKLAAQDFAALASVLSGLVSGYSKDLQYDKELLFGAWDRSRALLLLAERHIRLLHWNEEALERSLGPQLKTLWLADRLVLELIPFRKAHHLVGRLVRRATTVGFEAALDELIEGEGLQNSGLKTAFEQATPGFLLAELQSSGSASPVQTRAELEGLRSRINSP